MVRVWDEAPSTRTAVLALAEAMARWGVPEVVYSDNGSDFRSRGVFELLIGAGVEQVFSVPYNPRSRGRIERAYRTIKEKVLPQLPGYRGGPHPVAWHDQDLLTLPELERWIQLGVEEHINQAVCRTTRQIPNEHYDRAIGAHAFRRPRNPPMAALLPLLLRDDDVRVDAAGFLLGGRRYHCDAFAELANGSAVTVFHDPYRPKLAYVAVPQPGGMLEYLGTAEVYGPGNPPPAIGEQARRADAFRARTAALRARTRDEALRREALAEAAELGHMTGIEAAAAVIEEFDRLAAPVPAPLALPAASASEQSQAPPPASEAELPAPAVPADHTAAAHLRPAASRRGGTPAILVSPWD